jgi:hypothetical protein
VRMKERKRKQRNARGEKNICVLVCAPEAPQLAGDGDGVLAGGGVGVAACVRASKCIYNYACACVCQYINCVCSVCLESACA